MLNQLLQWIRQGRCPQPQRQRVPFQLFVETLEQRLTPADATWQGPAGGLWSVAANWNTAAVPGPNDDAIFDGAVSNNNSSMDIAPVAGQPITVGELTIKGGYSGTITLAHQLIINVLNMSSGKIYSISNGVPENAGPTLGVRQDGNPVFVAASSWTGGEIGTGVDSSASVLFSLKVIGSATHP
jgi:hypothetical protein